MWESDFTIYCKVLMPSVRLTWWDLQNVHQTSEFLLNIVAVIVMSLLYHDSSISCFILFNWYCSCHRKLLPFCTSTLSSNFETRTVHFPTMCVIVFAILNQNINVCFRLLFTDSKVTENRLSLNLLIRGTM